MPTTVMNQLRFRSRLRDDASVLRWAATLPDREVLTIRNIGRKGLAWLRGQPVPMLGQRERAGTP